MPSQQYELGNQRTQDVSPATKVKRWVQRACQNRILTAVRSSETGGSQLKFNCVFSRATLAHSLRRQFEGAAICTFYCDVPLPGAGLHWSPLRRTVQACPAMGFHRCYSVAHGAIWTRSHV